MDNTPKRYSFTEQLQKAPYLKDDVVNFIFNNIRNIGLSLLPMAAARAYVKDPQGDSQALVVVVVLILAFIALALLGLNIAYGWRRLSELRAPRWLVVPGALIYAFAIAMVWVLLMGVKP